MITETIRENKRRSYRKNIIANREKKRLDGIKRRKEHPIRMKEIVDKYRAKNVYKYKTQMILCQKVRSGKIVKPKNCEKCGEIKKLHGHHEDYSKPLDVIWLCPVCHKKTHSRQRQ